MVVHVKIHKVMQKNATPRDSAFVFSKILHPSKSPSCCPAALQSDGGTVKPKAVINFYNGKIEAASPDGFSTYI